MNWGIDLGGTKIEGIVLNDQMETVSRKRVITEADHGMNHIIEQIQLVISQLSEETGIKPSRLGIGTPGSIDPKTGLLKNSNTLVLNHQPFHKELGKVLGIPVAIANDANCFALAEYKMGAVTKNDPSATSAFGVIMGTGVGGGLILNGKIHEGRNGNGGEWGHTFLHESGGPCYCGDIGCTETIISGTGCQKYYEQLTGQFKKMKDIYKSYQLNNDPASTETVRRLLHFYGIGISNIINTIDPDAIVIGGGLSNLDILYTEGLEQIKEHTFSPTFNTPILPPLLGDSAGVFGAALL